MPTASPPELAAILRRADLDLRHGNGDAAWEAIRHVPASRLPPKLRSTYAWLAWRLGRPGLGLRLLGRRMSVVSQLRAPAPADEVAEYAACLIYAGVTAEGRHLLDGLASEELPRALLYQGFARVSEWDYAGSIPFFRRYVASTGLTAYQSVVGRVNLAAALVYERRYLAAESLLRELAHETSARRLALLHGVVLEFHAASLILRRRYREAEAFLEASARKLARVPGLDAFFVRKWTALGRLFESRGEAGTRAELGTVRKEAEARGHWETVRDCDRYLALATRDAALARQVYLGTPFPAFRERLARDFGGGLRLPPQASLFLGDGEIAGVLDLRKHARASALGPGDLKAGGLAHRLIAALASDAYRPFSPGRLFQTVFPNERYLGASSAHRIQVAVARCRSLLARQGLGVDIASVSGAYRLLPRSGRIEIRVDRDGSPSGNTRAEILGFELARAFGTTPFSISQAATVVKLSRRTLVRELGEAVKAGVLERTGSHARTRYHVRET